MKISFGNNLIVIKNRIPSEYKRRIYKSWYNLTILYGLKEIGIDAFSHENIYRLKLPKTLRIICAHAFEDNHIDKVELPKGLLEIRAYAFCQNNLQSVTIPDSVSYIGENAFDSNILIKYRNFNFDSYFIKEYGCENIIIASRILNKCPNFDFTKITKSQFLEISQNINSINIYELASYMEKNREQNNNGIMKDERKKMLKIYKKSEIPEIKTKNIEHIIDYGSDLTKQSELINLEYSNFIYDSPDIKLNEEELKNTVLTIQGFNKQENINADLKKDSLNKLDSYLVYQSRKLQNDLENLYYIKKMVVLYIKRSDVYLKNLNEALDKINKEIENNIEEKDDFEIYDYRLKQQVLKDKIIGIEQSIIYTVQQYQRINMQIGTNVSLISKLDIAHNTVMHNLYIELFLSENLMNEKDVCSSLSYLNKLLDEVSLVNSSEVVEVIKSVNTSDTDLKVLNQEDKKVLASILDNKKDTLEKVRKKDKKKKASK